jgi:hypothetical protein
MLGKQLLCTRCGTVTSNPLLVQPGSGWVTGVLALCFVMPGVVYAVWRYTCRKSVCPLCQSDALIPTDAPLARTWLHAGWIPSRGPDASGATLTPDTRLERIEQAIDAIAIEVERMGEVQRASLRAPSDRPALERPPNDRRTTTPV